MLRRDLTTFVQAAVDWLVAEGRLPAGLPGVELQDTKDPAHGDFATNFAMVASKAAGMNPRALAELVAGALNPLSSQGRGSDSLESGVRVDPQTGTRDQDERLPSPPSPLSPSMGEGGPLASVEIAGPGFINLRLNPEFVASYVPGVARSSTSDLAGGRMSGTPPLRSGGEGAGGWGRRINVEFVSVNPNGPITIGSGRGAAFGSTLANVLEAAGHTVHREYYINDGVNSEQMRGFAEGVRAIALGNPLPAGGYNIPFTFECAKILVESPWEDLLDLKDQLTDRLYLVERLADSSSEGPWLRGRLEGELRAISEFGDGLQSNFESAMKSVSTSTLIRFVTHLAVHRQRLDLEAFAVRYPSLRTDLVSGWQYESRLHDLGLVEREIDALVAKGAADDRPIRHKLKLAKGGVIEDVEVEEQAAEDEPGLEVEGEAPHPPAPSPRSGEGESNDPRPSTLDPHKTLWLRSTKFGDDMDRVLRRKDGRLTYIASDIAYHKDKLERTKWLTPPPNPLPASGEGESGAKLITILGPDHHGYIGRLHAVLAAIEAPTPSSGGEGAGGWGDAPPVEAKLYGSPAERDACLAALEKARKELDVVIFQLVRFMKDGKPAPMRKRDGNIYALIDLIDEIGKKVKPEASLEEQRKSGKDVARFFYLMRSHDTTFDFDLDLAEKQSEDNPVFYVQYAHARICSVLRKAEATFTSSPKGEGEVPHPPAPYPRSGEGEFRRLIHPKETALIKKVLDLPYEVSRCAEDYGVHRLTTYAIELARSYHHFYDACRVIQSDQPELTQARLLLCEATRVALQAVFELLGIEAPESM